MYWYVSVHTSTYDSADPVQVYTIPDDRCGKVGVGLGARRKGKIKTDYEKEFLSS
jgi:hypothetical protein